MNKYLKHIRCEIVLEILFSAIESLSLAGIAYIPKVIFDSVITEVSFNKIVYTIILFCALALISVISVYFGMIFNWKFAVKFENAIKKDYFKALVHYDDIKFHKRKVSEYISIQSNDIMQIEQDYLTPLISAVNEIIKVIIFGTVMFFAVDYRIAVVIFVLSSIAAVLPKYTGKMTSLKRLEFTDNMGKYTDLIYDFFNGFREINSKTVKAIEKKHLSKLNEVRDKRYSYGKSKSLSLSINELVRKMVQIAGFVMTAVLLIKGEITLGTGAATLGFINSFVDPLEETLYCFTTMETVKEVKDKVFNILLSNEKKEDKIKKEFNTAIELKDVCVHKGEFTLKNISLKLEKNKHYAIIGSNGSGKSTLLNSIVGYLPIDSGKVLIDGNNLFKYDLSWLITYVVQHSHIFVADYYENVTMFNSYNDLTVEFMRKIGINDNLVNKIMNQENSTKLSGGEQQILAYIRARNSGTPIIIMDEPFSAVDKNSKELLMRDISLLKDKTIIMITHDIDESLNYFDEVIKLKDGQVV